MPIDPKHDHNFTVEFGRFKASATGAVAIGGGLAFFAMAIGARWLGVI